MEESGNTSNSPLKTAVIRCRRWCLTINNYNEDIMTQCLNEFEGAEYVIGEEVGAEGTPHLQIYVKYKSQRTFASLKKKFPTAHIEKAKGNDKQNYLYCTKDGNFKSNIDFRTQTDKLKQLCLETEYSDVEWRPWQLEIINMLQEKPDKRSINWYWEATGNVGKSYLCKYLALTMDVIIADGKKDNVFNQVKDAIDNEKAVSIILLDVPRTSVDYINYGTIESLKNGCIYSGKYEGGQCLFPIPHVIVFANEEPEYEACSADRWQVRELEG